MNENLFKKIYLIAFIFLYSGCETREWNKNQGGVALQLRLQQSQELQSEHAELDHYEVIIQEDGLQEIRREIFDRSSTGAVLEGFPSGSIINVILEYYNVNGVVFRRGRAENIRIRGGEWVAVPLEVNNVPLFTNVVSGSVVRSDRFVPEIFAPGGVRFELFDESLSGVRQCTDTLTLESTFSVSENKSDSLRRIFVGDWVSGRHVLTLRDPDSGESNSVTLELWESNQERYLLTTAGGYLGTLMNRSQIDGFHVPSILQQESSIHLK